MGQGAERSRLRARRRPTRSEIEPVALALLQRHGATIMAVARRFAATPEDAEDAYQRGVEILLTKAPTTAEDELVPWLRTVVKHEAWAIRRQRQRAAPVADDGRVPEPLSEVALTHDQAERLDRLRIGAEALKHLKPQEIRALVLRAEGYSYKQIQELTGWTYTKVNAPVWPEARSRPRAIGPEVRSGDLSAEGEPGAAREVARPRQDHATRTPHVVSPRRDRFRTRCLRAHRGARH